MSQIESQSNLSTSGPVLDIAIWVDATMLQREAAFVGHLITGLKSEGQRVSIIAQHGLDLSTLSTLGSRVITYRWNRWEKLTMIQRMRLAGVIEELTARPPDVLLLWGSTGISTVGDAAAITLVQQTAQLPAIIWCWDSPELFTPLVQSPHVKHVIASSQPILERVPTGFRVPVTLIHPGVYCDEVQACYDVEGQVACLVSLDPLSDMPAYEALIRACRKIADEGEEYLLFAYDQGRQEHPIWQLAQRLELLDRVSFVPFQQDAEPLLLHGDLYLHVLPNSRVGYRTLEAMGKGLAVVTSPNPGADYLIDGQTCRFVGGGGAALPTAEAWRDVLLELLRDRAKAIGLARRGQQLVRERHAMSQMLGQFFSVCRQAAGTPLRLVGVE